MHLSGCVEYSCFHLSGSKVGLGLLHQYGQQQRLDLLKWEPYTSRGAMWVFFFCPTPLGFKALPFSQYLVSHVQTHSLLVVYTHPVCFLHFPVPYVVSFSDWNAAHTPNSSCNFRFIIGNEVLLIGQADSYDSLCSWYLKHIHCSR